MREVEEEAGLVVRVERLLGLYSVPENCDLVFNFLCSPFGGSLRLSSEANDLQWFKEGNIPSNTLPRHAERIQDAYVGSKNALLKEQV